MSLFDLSNPKNACHIQRSYDAITSKIIVCSWIWPQYWHFHAARQFFHFQCMQSIEPKIPKKSRHLPWANNLAMSSLFGFLKYSSDKTSTTTVTNFFKLYNAVVSPIRTYSSIKSPDIPYASILSATVIFYKEDRSSLLALSLFWTK